MFFNGFAFKNDLEASLFMEFDIYNELKAIATRLQNPEQLFQEDKVSEIALHTGLSGVILTLIAIQKQFPELVDLQVVEQYVSKAYDILAESEIVYPSFSGGLAGYAFLLLQLEKEKHICLEDYSEIIAEIDEIIAEHFEINLKNDHIDILHGAMGMALYFLERGKYQYAEKLIDTLEITAKREENRIYWNTFDYYKTRKYKIDFGLAHGNAGIQYFLGKCIHHNIKTSESRRLLEESLNFFHHNTQDIESAKSYFPTMMLEEHYIEKNTKPETSRVAWCYGDAGILYTHLLLSDVLKEELLKIKTIEKLKQLAQRRTVEEAMYNDAGFCHGTGGLAVIFKNSYNLTGESVFLETSQYWLQQTYNYKIANSDRTAYCLYEGSIKKENDVTLLEGISGVAAAYLAVLSPTGTPLIDKAVFLGF